MISSHTLKKCFALFANSEYNLAMILKPQDIFILLKLVSLGKAQWSYASLSRDLYMSTSEVHAGMRRTVAAHLMGSQKGHLLKKAFEEFLIHGIKYAFPPDHGSLTRGIPTSYAAPPLKDLISQTTEPPPIWPDPEGSVRGYEFSPLYKSVPKAALKDRKLYELLALVDAIRDGRTRERGIAIRELKARLESPLMN